jgi:[protein-PII] uridylyltransferase
MADTGNMALAQLIDGGADEAAVEALWQTYPDEAFLRYRPGAAGVADAGLLAHAAQPSQVLVRAHHTPGSFEVFVRTPDRDGVFAALVASLDRLGLSVLEARVLSSTDGHALDNFQVQASAPAPSRSGSSSCCRRR